MIRALVARLGVTWVHGARPAPVEDAASTLVLAVSDAGWRGLILHEDGRPPEQLEDGAALDDTPAAASVTALGALQRAVRAIPMAERAGIGRVRLLVADPAIALADNRATRIRGSTAEALCESGAQLLGCTAAVGGFHRFGQSSDNETQRGVHVFASNDQVSQWLGALDSLAIRLVELLPADALLLAPGGAEPFLAVHVGAGGTTVLIADPASGAVALRRLPVGVLTFAAALQDASAISAPEALAGLARRRCLPAPGAAASPTPTDRALAPILSALQADLLELADYFVFQRLAAAPERLVVSGEAHRVRGLIEWLAQATDLPATAVPGPAERFLAHDPARDGASALPNLLDSVPKGLLRVGRVDYSFIDGRFRSDPTDAAGARGGASRGGILRHRLALAARLPRWRQRHTAAAVSRLGAPGLTFPGLAAAALLASIGVAAIGVPGVDPAADPVADAEREHAAARAAYDAAAARPRPDASAGAVVVTDTLLAITDALPPAVWLTRLSVPAEGTGKAEPRRLLLEGRAQSDTADPVEPVTTILARLTADPAFMRGVARLELDGVTAEPDGLRFAISLVFAPPAGMTLR